MNGRPRTYFCTTGHEVPEAQLELLTEIVTMDAGAVVRICREHGAPIGETVEPAPSDDAGDAGRRA